MADVIKTVEEMSMYCHKAKLQGHTVGFIPTMGALHEGHMSLIRQARVETSRVIVSIFVNPLQFTIGEDYNRYPRNLTGDIRLVAMAGGDVVFAPSVGELYPKGFITRIDQDGLPEQLCGEFRPGHFRGVMTIVAKLFHIVQPDITYFGQKDYQQAVIVHRMAADLNFPLKVKVMPIVREPDGLAMSSRNSFLGPKQRKDAACLYRSLRLAERLVRDGERSTAKIIGHMRKEIRRVKGARIDYINIVAPETLTDVKEVCGKVVAAIAVRIGKTRLIDNAIIS